MKSNHSVECYSRAGVFLHKKRFRQAKTLVTSGVAKWNAEQTAITFCHYTDLEVDAMNQKALAGMGARLSAAEYDRCPIRGEWRVQQPATAGKIGFKTFRHARYVLT